MKPRVILTGKNFRILRTPSGWMEVETKQGRDRLGVARWVDLQLTDAAAREVFSYFVEDIGRSLLKRDIRRRRRAAGGRA